MNIGFGQNTQAPLLNLRHATVDDIPFVSSTQRMPHVRDFVGEVSDHELAAIIENPGEALLIGEKTDGSNVGFAYLCGLGMKNRSVELRKIAIGDLSGGFGQPFIKLITKEVFEKLGANRLWLDVFPHNSRARHVYRQAGFVEEGTLRDHCFWNGQLRSVIIMSILAVEYKAADK